MGAHHNHSHGHGHDKSKAREFTLWIAASLTAGFMVIEFLAGWWSQSLALMADAVHMLADAGALGLALFAVRLSGRHADDHRTFGYGRLQVLAAFINGLVVLGLGSLIFTQAFRRLYRGTTPEIDTGMMMWVGIAGLVLNIVVLLVLHRGDTRSVNIRAAMAHVMGDTLSSAAVIIGALLIVQTGWYAWDAVATMIVALFIANSAKNILTESGHILLEGRPPSLKLDEVTNTIKGMVPEVIELHHVHAWSLSGEDVLITLHARLVEGAGRSDDEILAAIKTVLREKFGIYHSTVQSERHACADAHNHDHAH